jgi:hypothetical protein
MEKWIGIPYLKKEIVNLWVNGDNSESYNRALEDVLILY